MHCYSVRYACETVLINTCLNEASNVTLSAALNSCLVSSVRKMELIHRHYFPAFLPRAPLEM